MLRLRLFQSKTRGITILRANSRFQSLAFPRRFPIIRYLTRVPLSRSYVTQRRVSVRVFPKRFMNYVDGSVRGRGCVYVYMEGIHHGKRFWTVLAECCLYGIWWIGICIVRKKRVEILRFILSNHRHVTRIFHAVHIPKDLREIEWKVTIELEMENDFYFLFRANLFGNIRSIRQLSVTCSKY